jgi:hypothetical protein
MVGVDCHQAVSMSIARNFSGCSKLCQHILLTKYLVWFSKAKSESILLHDLAVLF